MGRYVQYHAVGCVSYRTFRVVPYQVYAFGQCLSCRKSGIDLYRATVAGPIRWCLRACVRACVLACRRAGGRA